MLPALSSVRPAPGVFAVARGIDYEPPAFGGPPPLPPIAAPRRRALPLPVHHSQAPRPDSAAAAAFADAALRRVLEVIDRRRPLAQLRPLLSGGLVDSLLVSSATRFDRTPARLRRVRTQTVNPDGAAAEVAAHYTRGARVHAIACRIEQLPTPAGPRWQVVALHMG